MEGLYKTLAIKIPLRFEISPHDFTPCCLLLLCLVLPNEELLDINSQHVIPIYSPRDYIRTVTVRSLTCTSKSKSIRKIGGQHVKN